MRLPFNEAKAAQAAAFLLKLNGGKMNYMSLIKLLYLADREALLTWGRPVTTDNYVSMDKGPVLSNTLNLINELREPGTPEIWNQYISTPKDYEVQLLKDAPDEELSPAEEELLYKIYAEHGRKNPWQLVGFVHKLPEWQDPHGSAIPIAYRDILSAGNKTEVEIASILEELGNLAAVHSLLTGE